jgi:tetratricopeptide (TPR) repeat protein
MAYPATPTQQLKVRLDAGVAAHHRGDLDGALEAYREVLAVAPEHAPALNLAGTALLQLGRSAEAVPFLERASRRQRDDPHVLANLAQAYLALNRYPEACEMFRKASRIAPKEAQLQAGIAAALALQGKLDEAQTLLQRLTTRFPRSTLVWLNLGNVLRDQRRHPAALEAYGKALELDPSMVEARNSVGRALHSLLRFADAEREYRACIAAAPDDLVSRFNLASVTMDMGRYAEAEAVSRELLSRAPDVPAAHRLLGTALAQQARLLEALTCYERAARIAPDDHRTAQAYGTALMEAGHSAAGLRWLAHAVFLEPESVSCKQVESGALLAHGCLQDGWRGYAHRPAALALREEHRALHPVLSLPQDLAGKHVCVLAEQGLGDELFFLRHAPLLAARGARVSCRPAGKLHSLLERAAALDRLLPENAELPRADLFLLAGDLPHALGELASSALRDAGRRADAYSALPDFGRQIRLFWPQPAPTLRIAPLPGRMEEIADRLAAFGPPPYLGITWRGGTAPEEQLDVSLLHKSIALPALAHALEAVPGTIVALQRRPARGEMDALAASLARPVHDLTALNDDLESMLALLALLDEYIGVSNTNMHLRAAAGRTARVLVPVPAEWRWMQSGRSSPWFPGFGIYRQSLQGDWSNALARLAADLEANHRPGGRSNAC